MNKARDMLRNLVDAIDMLRASAYYREELDRMNKARVNSPDDLWNELTPQEQLAYLQRRKQQEDESR